MAKGGGRVQCVTKKVIVEGNEAVWIFVEFETNKSQKSLTKWLIPDQWSTWGKPFFREMKRVGGKEQVSTRSGHQQWHANYLEKVSLQGQELNTVLRCNVKLEGNAWAAMTYDLNHSVGDMLQVDRGYLAAVDIGRRRQVKALKVVGFTNRASNDLALEGACPLWGTVVKNATSVAGARAKDRSANPTFGAIGDDGTDGTQGGSATAAFAESWPTQWAGTVTDWAQFYSTYANDVGNRMWSGKYGQQDAIDDSSRLYMRLARDWAQAWKTGTTMIQQAADMRVPSTGGTGTPVTRRTTEYTTVMVRSPKKGVSVEITDLTRVDTKPAKLKAADITIEPKEIPAGPDIEVRLEADTTATPPGLYVGSLLLGPSGKRQRVPVLFYVSKARLAS